MNTHHNIKFNLLYNIENNFHGYLCHHIPSLNIKVPYRFRDNYDFDVTQLETAMVLSFINKMPKSDIKSKSFKAKEILYNYIPFEKDSDFVLFIKDLRDNWIMSSMCFENNNIIDFCTNSEVASFGKKICSIYDLNLNRIVIFLSAHWKYKQSQAVTLVNAWIQFVDNLVKKFGYKENFKIEYLNLWRKNISIYANKENREVKNIDLYQLKYDVDKETKNYCDRIKYINNEYERRLEIIKNKQVEAEKLIKTKYEDEFVYIDTQIQTIDNCAKQITSIGWYHSLMKNHEIIGYHHKDEGILDNIDRRIYYNSNGLVSGVLYNNVDSMGQLPYGIEKMGISTKSTYAEILHLLSQNKFKYTVSRSNTGAKIFADSPIEYNGFWEISFAFRMYNGNPLTGSKLLAIKIQLLSGEIFHYGLERHKLMIRKKELTESLNKEIEQSNNNIEVIEKEKNRNTNIDVQTLTSQYINSINNESTRKQHYLYVLKLMTYIQIRNNFDTVNTTLIKNELDAIQKIIIDKKHKQYDLFVIEQKEIIHQKEIQAKKALEEKKKNEDLSISDGILSETIWTTAKIDNYVKRINANNYEESCALILLNQTLIGSYKRYFFDTYVLEELLLKIVNENIKSCKLMKKLSSFVDTFIQYYTENWEFKVPMSVLTKLSPKSNYIESQVIPYRTKKKFTLDWSWVNIKDGSIEITGRKANGIGFETVVINLNDCARIYNTWYLGFANQLPTINCSAKDMKLTIDKNALIDAIRKLKEK